MTHEQLAMCANGLRYTAVEYLAHMHLALPEVPIMNGFCFQMNRCLDDNQVHNKNPSDVWEVQSNLSN